MKKYSGIIVRHNNKVLLCKRNSQGGLPGYWSCPAGGVELGENLKDAAYREFYEETDIKINGQIRFISAVKRHSRDGTKFRGILNCFLYDSNEEIYPDLESASHGDEHTECGYFDKNNLPEPMTTQFRGLLKIILK